MVPTDNLMLVNNFVRIWEANQNGQYRYTLKENLKKISRCLALITFFYNLEY
jgi:hypothetical protein